MTADIHITVDGKAYRISPSGLVWSGYTRPSDPELGVVWKRMQRGSIRSTRVLVAAGLAAPQEPASTGLTKRRHYAIDY